MSKFQDGPSRSDQIQRAPVRFRLDQFGRKMRVYACVYCRDAATVSLPDYREGETDEDVLGMGELGARFCYPCPACKGIDQNLLPNDLYPITKARLRHWIAARRAELDRQAADSGDRNWRYTFADAQKQAAKMAADMPSLPVQEQREIAAQMREAAKGEVD